MYNVNLLHQRWISSHTLTPLSNFWIDIVQHIWKHRFVTKEGTHCRVFIETISIQIKYSLFGNHTFYRRLYGSYDWWEAVDRLVAKINRVLNNYVLNVIKNGTLFSHILEWDRVRYRSECLRILLNYIQRYKDAKIRCSNHHQLDILLAISDHSIPPLRCLFEQCSVRHIASYARPLNSIIVNYTLHI